MYYAADFGDERFNAEMVFYITVVRPFASWSQIHPAIGSNAQLCCVELALRAVVKSTDRFLIGIIRSSEHQADACMLGFYTLDLVIRFAAFEVKSACLNDAWYLSAARCTAPTFVFSDRNDRTRVSLP